MIFDRNTHEAHIKQLGDVPIIKLIATATPKVQEDIFENLDMCDAKTLSKLQ
jgi:superfamily II DNA helicase RecQ